MFSVSITHYSKIRELSDGNNHPKPSQIIIHLWDPLVLDDGSWKLSDVTQFSCYPNNLLTSRIYFIVQDSSLVQINIYIYICMYVCMYVCILISNTKHQYIFEFIVQILYSFGISWNNINEFLLFFLFWFHMM